MRYIPYTAHACINFLFLQSISTAYIYGLQYNHRSCLPYIEPLVTFILIFRDLFTVYIFVNSCKGTWYICHVNVLCVYMNDHSRPSSPWISTVWTVDRVLNLLPHARRHISLFTLYPSDHSLAGPRKRQWREKKRFSAVTGINRAYLTFPPDTEFSDFFFSEKRMSGFFIRISKTGCRR